MAKEAYCIADLVCHEGLLHTPRQAALAPRGGIREPGSGGAAEVEGQVEVLLLLYLPRLDDGNL